MSNLPTCTLQKLKAFFILILLFWHLGYSQKIEIKQLNSTVLQNCWKYPLTNTTEIGVASDNVSDLYIPLSDGRLLSINSLSGKKHWEAELGGDIASLPMIKDGVVYVAAKYNSGQNNDSFRDENQSAPTMILRALDKSTGVTQWQIALEPAEKLYLASFENYIVAIGGNGRVISVNRVDGRLVWKKHLDTKLSAPPLVKNSEAYLGTADSRILNLSLADGQITEKLKISAPPTVIVENTTKNKLIVGDRKGNLLSIEKKFNKKMKTIEWRLRNGAEISSVTPTAEGLLISSFDNFIYLISEDGGKLLWKKRLSGRITTAPLVNGNYFVVSVTDESVASVVELKSGRSVNKITLDEDNFFTGSSIRTEDFLVYSTLKGIFGYSFNNGGDGCGAKQKSGT